MKVTIKQIAQEAGVSVTTVSNVVNNKAHRVSAEKREIIQAIIKKYDYVPNMNARSLVNSSSRLIGLLYFSHEAAGPVDFSTPFASEVLEGVERKVKELGYFTLIHNVTNVDEILTIKNNWLFEGFIAVSFSQEMFEKVRGKLKEPTIFVDTHLEPKVYQSLKDYPDCFVINTDDFEMGKKATRYLISQGHRQIAFLSHHFDEEQPGVIKERYHGFKATMEQEQLPLRKENFFYEEQMSKLLAQIDNFTGVVVDGDDLALQFIHFLRVHGKKVPEDLSIIGFDDIRFAAYSDPPLTTIRLNQINKGEQAMEMLIKEMQKPQEKRKQLVSLPGELVIRETVGKPKK
ncbi:LacI family DNA-binding transcriptional regulator [Enterococcus sp. LJL120]